MKHIRQFHTFLNEGHNDHAEGEMAEIVAQLDKWLPGASHDEYYTILDDEESTREDKVRNLTALIDNKADTDFICQYIDFNDICKLAEYIVDSEGFQSSE
jgi:hypothetical protein